MKKFWTFVSAAVGVLVVVAAVIFVVRYWIENNSPMSYMKEIYGEENLETLQAHGDGHTGGLVLCYIDRESVKAIGYVTNENAFILENKFEYYSGGDICSLEIDRKEYTADSVMTLTLENTGSSPVACIDKRFVVERMMDGGWYTIHTGEIKKAGEEIILEAGESFALDIALDSLRELSEDKLILPAGQYRISKYVNLMDENAESAERTWFSQEFEIVE